MTVTIRECTETTELLRRYHGQNEPQGAYIELGLRHETMHATYNAEIGGAIPFSVYHGHDRRYGIPTFTAKAANRLMHELLPLAERVVAGYESVWDGHNHVAHLSEDAQAADAEIAERCEFECENASEPDVLQYTDASDWLDMYRDDLTKKTDAELTALAEQIDADALADGFVVDGTEDRLLQLRDQQRENAES